jgi:hypothetical protein
MSKVIVALTLSLVLQIGGSFATDLKDPQFRDEDISNLNLSVEYFTRTDGLIEYVYRLESPIDNKGEISDLIIDLACSEGFEPASPPPLPDTAEYFPLQDGTPAHTPSAVTADSTESSLYGINGGAQAFWSFDMMPGEVRTTLRIVSPAEPGIRAFTVSPWMESTGWNYPDHGEDIGEEQGWPRIDDFIVTGMIAAPGCPNVTEPPGKVLTPQ